MELLHLLPPLPPATNPYSSGGIYNDEGLRFLQRQIQQLPDYTSPPLTSAIEATPENFQSDAAVDAAREYDAEGLCLTLDDPSACQIAFFPPPPPLEDGVANRSKVGVVFYGGALVDPRGYSPMMRMLSDTYGLSVSVPIFDGDLAFKFGTCESGRLGLAQRMFPGVEKWVLAGHSFGGLVAVNDLWAIRNNTDGIAGLALVASYVRQDLGCGMPDFSTEEWDWLPVASVSATLDGVINVTNFEEGQKWLPPPSSGNNNGTTLALVIEGGNHGQFGTYNDSERSTLLSQNDGMATISAEGQQEQAAGAIAYVATFGDSSVGGQDKVSPARSPTQSSNTTAGNDTVSPTRSPTQSPTTTSLSSAGFMASASASQNLFNAILAAAVAVWAAFAI